MKEVFVEGLKYHRIEKDEIDKHLPSLLANYQFKFVTGHWTAGRYNRAYSHYQLNIGNDYILLADLSHQGDKNLHGHTWKRNSFNFGWAFMAMFDKTCPVTPQMIELCAKIMAHLKKKYNLNWEQFKEHAYWANLDGYAGLRWDVHLILNDAESKKAGKPNGELLMERIIRKANWYLTKI